MIILLYNRMLGKACLRKAITTWRACGRAQNHTQHLPASMHQMRSAAARQLLREPQVAAPQLEYLPLLPGLSHASVCRIRTRRTLLCCFCACRGRQCIQKGSKLRVLVLDCYGGTLMRSLPLSPKPWYESTLGQLTCTSSWSSQMVGQSCFAALVASWSIVLPMSTATAFKRFQKTAKYELTDIVMTDPVS